MKKRTRGPTDCSISESGGHRTHEHQSTATVWRSKARYPFRESLQRDPDEPANHLRTG